MTATEAEMKRLRKAVDDADDAVDKAEVAHDAALKAFRDADCPHPEKYVKGGMFYTTCDLCDGTLD